MQEPAGRKAIAQATDQFVGAVALGWAQRGGVPFRRLVIVDRNECGLAAHREAHIAAGEVLVDLLAQRIERRPCFIGEWVGHARLFRDARDGHVEGEGNFRRFDRAADRRRGAEVGRGGEREVALPAQQAGRGVEPDPARTRHVHFSPGVQVGEILRRTCGPIDRKHVRPQLDQIARHEARREADVTQDLHEQPRAVAARARLRRKRLLRRLHADFHADQIADLMVQTLIEANQEIDDIHPIAWDRSEKRRQQRTRRLGIEKRRKLLGELRGIGERESLRERLYEEVERIDHRHVGDQIDGDLEFAGLFREYEAREPVSVRVLQPVHEMLCRRHLERIARYASAAMRRGPQPDDLWSETDGAFVPVARGMVKTDEDRHTPLCCVERNRVTFGPAISPRALVA